MQNLTPEYLWSYNGKVLDLSNKSLSLDQIKALPIYQIHEKLLNTYEE